MARNGYESDRTRLCVLDLKTGAKTYVTEAFQSGADGFCWAADSRSFYFTGVWQARSMVHSTNLKGEVRPLTTGNFDYGAGLALCGKASSSPVTASVRRMTFTAFPLKKKNAEIRQLTRETDISRERLEMGEVKERWVATTGWQEGTLLGGLPASFRPGQKISGTPVLRRRAAKSRQPVLELPLEPANHGGQRLYHHRSQPPRPAGLRHGVVGGNQRRLQRTVHARLPERHR